MNLMECSECGEYVEVEDEFIEDPSHDEVRVRPMHVIALACGHNIDLPVTHERSEP